MPIILMSGEVTEFSGGDGVAKLIKPFRLEELLRMITSLIAGH